MPRLLLAVVLAAGLLAACGGGEDAPATGGAQPESTAAPTPAPTEPSGLPRVRVERVFPNVRLNRLTGLYQTPDGRWLALEQTGRVMVFPDEQNARASVFLDLSAKVLVSSEEGLLGLALAPDFAQSGVFYVYYSAPNPRRSVLSRFRAEGNAADPASETVILEIPQSFANHNGGQILFGPDGYLYVGLGDGGSARDPMGNGQNLNTLLGKLLRIDVSGAATYRVPPDNPFVGRQDVRPEIWALGLRNPWRFSFDRETGRLWLADVGQNAREEIDIVAKGGNYGWSIMEGSQCLSGGTCDRSGLSLPLFDYARVSPHCSVTGGFVYRGRQIPGLVGAYLYSDYCSGFIWALRERDGAVTEQAEIGRAGFQVSSFAEGNDGELYVLEHSGSGGGIYKIVP